jgi:hypothetical protein
MGTSILIARIFGLSYLIIGICFLFNRKGFAKIMEDFGKNAALTFYGGLMALVIGIVIILKHNLWVSDWRVMITIFGWAGLIKGIWLLGFPDSVSGFMKAYKKNKGLMTVHATVAIILGVVLTYLGFFS